MTTVSARLRAASDGFYRLGREFDAIFTRELADSAERTGCDALYLKWTEQQEQRLARMGGQQ